MHRQQTQSYTQWGLPKGAIARLSKGAVGRIKFSPDGSQLAVTGALGLWLYDVNSCKEVMLLRAGDDRTTPLPSAWNGTTLVTHNWDETISLWDTLRGQRQIHIKQKLHQVSDVVLTPDGTMLFTAAWDSIIRCWDS
ncbi:WD40 repeat domain-containing protein [Candidatus Poribacteria bacterium]|nr:WD40 repeat domain-containing protein [Candidatus Poribacteria bacterium]MYI95237.1 WD40 repeat domain-containing protein [Candidatus Poribacteria bacterium]